jgi:hypothetical protein
MPPLPPAFDSQRQALHAIIDAAGLSTHRDALDAVVRPGIGLRTRPATPADLAAGATRVGGEPDLPATAEWPVGEDGPLLFVLQVRLSDVAALDVEHRLPADGLLAVFTDRFAQNVRLVYTPAHDLVTRRPWAPTFCGPFRACGVDGLPELHVPPPGSSWAETLPLQGEEWSTYWDAVWLEWRERLRPGAAGTAGIHQLLGYAMAEQHEEQEPHEEVVVGFDSDDRVGMEWGDVHCVWVLMDRDALAARDWASTRAAM